MPNLVEEFGPEMEPWPLLDLNVPEGTKCLAIYPPEENPDPENRGPENTP